VISVGISFNSWPLLPFHISETQFTFSLVDILIQEQFIVSIGINGRSKAGQFGLGQFVIICIFLISVLPFVNGLCLIEKVSAVSSYYGFATCKFNINDLVSMDLDPRYVRNMFIFRESALE
jgi:hypothetical protein